MCWICSFSLLLQVFLPQKLVVSHTCEMLRKFPSVCLKHVPLCVLNHSSTFYKSPNFCDFCNSSHPAYEKSVQWDLLVPVLLIIYLTTVCNYLGRILPDNTAGISIRTRVSVVSLMKLFSFVTGVVIFSPNRQSHFKSQFHWINTQIMQNISFIQWTFVH